MGRSISTSSYSSTPPNALGVLAGEAITEKDLVELNAIDGKACKVRVTDYAAVSTMTYGTAQTTTGTGRITAQTNVNGSTVQSDITQYRQPVVTDASGNIYVLTQVSSGSGLFLAKFSPAGILITSVVVDASNNYQNLQLLKLDNGNLVCLGIFTTNLNYAVYDSNLSVVASITGFSDTARSSEIGFSACALSGAGFAFVYQQNANPLLSRIVTFSNTGVAVLTATTIWTRTGTTNSQYHKMLQLSNGNLVIAVTSQNTASSIGLFYGIVTTAGVSVVAFTNIDTVNVAVIPELSVMSGYFAISRANGTNQIASVFNNAGTLQGTGFTSATTNGTGPFPKTKLVNDGTSNFYLIWQASTTTTCNLTKIPVTGTGYVTGSITGSTNQYSFYTDAFYENGFIVQCCQQGGVSTSPIIYVADTTTLKLVSTSPTSFGTAPGTANGNAQRIISGGDGSFICVYDYATASNVFLCIGKYMNTAIVGVAATTVSAGSTVQIYQNAGAYATNLVNGSPSKAFDMSATTAQYGNKGTVTAYGTVLKGM